MIRFDVLRHFWFTAFTWAVAGGLVLATAAPSSANPIEVLTLDEAAVLLRVSPKVLEALARQRCVPGRRLESQWRFSRTALLAWLAGTDTSPDCMPSATTVATSNPTSLSPQETIPIQRQRTPLPSSELSRRMGRGPVSTFAQATQAPSAAKQPETVGEKPDLGTAEDVALRGQRVLLQPREVTLELGLFYSKREQQDLTLVPSGGGVLPTLANREQDAFISTYTARAGLFRDTQVFTSFSLLQQKSTLTVLGQEESATHTDIGDIAIGVRRTLFRERLRTPEVIVSMEGRLPTDESSYAVGGGVSLVKTIDPVVLFGSFSYLRTFSRTFDDFTRLQPEDTLSASLGYAVALNDTLSLTASVSGVFTLETEFSNAVLRSREQFSLQVGLTSLLTEKLYIEPTVSFALNGPGDTVTIGVSLPYTLGL